MVSSGCAAAARGLPSQLDPFSASRHDGQHDQRHTQRADPARRRRGGRGRGRRPDREDDVISVHTGRSRSSAGAVLTNASRPSRSRCSATEPRASRWFSQPRKAAQDGDRAQRPSGSGAYLRPGRRLPATSRRSARRARHGYSTVMSDRVPVIDHARPSPAPTKMCAVPAGLWKKSHGRDPLAALDEQPHSPERTRNAPAPTRRDRGRSDGPLEDVEPESELRNAHSGLSKEHSEPRASTSTTPRPEHSGRTSRRRGQACAGVLESCLGHAATLPAFRPAVEASTTPARPRWRALAHRARRHGEQ
jgi:hypothetical protein